MEFTNTYGDITDNFYYSVESVYASITDMLGKVKDGKLIDEFQPRLKAIVDDTDEIGWGFHD
ncbi:MAG: hypothetical protein FH756_17605 [Firmicutes bacterium]|nr:hypothetical protein [Bacillota bacterium]